MTFHEWLKFTRAAKGMTLADLSIASSVSKGHICEIEHGTAPNVTLLTANKLTRGLGFKLWQVLKVLNEDES